MTADDFDIDRDPYASLPGALRLANDLLLDAGTIALRVETVIEDDDNTISDLMRAISAVSSSTQILNGALRTLLDHAETKMFG